MTFDTKAGQHIQHIAQWDQKLHLVKRGEKVGKFMSNVYQLPDYIFNHVRFSRGQFWFFNYCFMGQELVK